MSFTSEMSRQYIFLEDTNDRGTTGVADHVVTSKGILAGCAEQMPAEDNSAEINKQSIPSIVVRKQIYLSDRFVQTTSDHSIAIAVRIPDHTCFDT